MEATSHPIKFRVLLVATMFPPRTPLRVRLEPVTMSVPVIVESEIVADEDCTVFMSRKTLSATVKEPFMVTPDSASPQFCWMVENAWFAVYK